MQQNNVRDYLSEFQCRRDNRQSEVFDPVIRINYFHLECKGIPNLTFIRGLSTYYIIYSHASVYLHDKFCENYVNMFCKCLRVYNSETRKYFAYFLLILPKFKL